MTQLNEDKINRTKLIIEQSKGKDLSDVIVNVTKLRPVGDIILEKLGKKNLSTEVLAGLAGLGRATVYKILNGKMRPSQDVLLRIAFVLEMNAEETQELLKSGHVSQLTAGRERDVVIIYGLQNHLSLGEMDVVLEDYGLPTLLPPE